MCAAPVLAKADGPYEGARSNTTVDWSGFYVGGRLGGAWSDVDWSQNYNYFTSNGPLLVGTDSSFSPSGVVGGVIGGGNVQLGSWVLGAEASFSGADLSSSQVSPFFPDTDVFSTKIEWLTTVEGRIGYACDRFLVFGKGGWAGGNVDLKLTDLGAGIIASGDTFANGWTIGGGVEYALGSNVIVGVAYDHTRLSYDASPACPNCGTGLGFGSPTISGDFEISSVTARATYLFNP